MKISLPMILTLLFLTLKLCGVIAWSWWWIFSPLWGAFIIYMLVVVGMTIALEMKK